MIYLFLAICAAERIGPGPQIQNLLEFIDWPYLSVEIHMLPRIAADNLREINEAERPGWIRGSRDPKSLKISKLSARRLGIDPRQRSKIFQNLLDWSFLVT